MSLKHGFKANAERKSLELRTTLNRTDIDCLDAFELSNHLGVSVFCPSFFLGKGALFNKLCSTSSKWSALTMENESGEKLIIHNTIHAEVRQQSNIMHELAHILCEHKLPVMEIEFDFLQNFNLRIFNEDHEKEAEILGSTLQIPRSGLLKLLQLNKSKEEIANNYKASLSLVQFRINNTGVGKQFNQRRNLS